MEIIGSIIVLLLGFIVLIKGADFLTDGASSIAKRFSIPEIAIGLTVVAFGTSAPELMVNIIASINNHNDITMGNIIGSNLFNILLILGIASLIAPLKIQRDTIKREIPFSFFATLVFFFLVNDAMFLKKESSGLSRLDGGILLGLFIFFFIMVFVVKGKIKEELEDIKVFPPFLNIALIVIGIAGLFLGGEVVVQNAVKLARALNISEKFIALTVVSMGTSLPELVTSAVAAHKNRFDLAVGNVIGSNIFNIFLILGVSSLISSISFSVVLNTDMYVLFGANLLIVVAMFTGKKFILDKWEGGFFLLTFISYLIFLFLRK